MPIYAVKQTLPQTDATPTVIRWHLVRAKSPGAAVRFVAAPLFEAVIPSPDDLVMHTINGLRITDAGSDE